MEKDNGFIPKKLRKIAFSQKFNLDTNLIQGLNLKDKEFDFLRNPVVQNIYNYQTYYVLDFSKKNRWIYWIGVAARDMFRIY